MKKNFTVILFFFLAISTFAQFLPASTAINIAPSLTFSSNVVNASSVVFNPNLNFYYIIRTGNSVFPLETLSDVGDAIYQTTAGIDTRGMWWNSNANQVERNGFSSGGWTNVHLDANGHALNSFTTIFAGQHQPDPQSVGAYDNHTNKVLYYAGGSTIYIYDRTTGLQENSLTLTGTSFTSTNANTVIYTGQVGYEIGLLDYTNKRILLFNRITGEFSGSSQLPNSAPTSSMFKFSYANNRVWLMNSATSTWNGYWIWNIVMATENLKLDSYLTENQDIKLSWKEETSNAPVNSYELTHSTNSIDYSLINTQKYASEKTNYDYLDKTQSSGLHYYRLKVTYLDGTTSYSNVEIITKNASEEDVFTIYPNPAQADVTIEFQAETLNGHSFMLFNEMGQLVKEVPFSAKESTKTINLEAMSAGTYFVKGGSKSLKLIKQ